MPILDAEILMHIFLSRATVCGTRHGLQTKFAGPIGPGRVRSPALSLRSFVFIVLSFSKKLRGGPDPPYDRPAAVPFHFYWFPGTPQKPPQCIQIPPRERPASL